MEREFHNWIINNQNTTNEKVLVGIGDDAGVYKFDHPVVITSDTVADGVHFDTTEHSLEKIGHKSIAVSISDIAAMGAHPVAASIDLLVPKPISLDDLKQLFSAIQKTADDFNTDIIGGDTNRWDGPLVISTTVYGHSSHNDPHQIWKLNGGHVDDIVCVTGPLGASILGHHLDFTPRVDIAGLLAPRFEITAATDISDSLAVDLAALAIKSGCGFHIDAEKIPLTDAAHQLARDDGRTALEHALHDGEDFELILCLAESEFRKIAADSHLSNHVLPIGKLTQANFVIEKDGKVKPLEIKGYEH